MTDFCQLVSKAWELLAAVQHAGGTTQSISLYSSALVYTFLHFTTLQNYSINYMALAAVICWPFKLWGNWLIVFDSYDKDSCHS